MLSQQPMFASTTLDAKPGKSEYDSIVITTIWFPNRSLTQQVEFWRGGTIVQTAGTIMEDMPSEALEPIHNGAICVMYEYVKVDEYKNY